MSEHIVPERIKKIIANRGKSARPNYLYEDIAKTNKELDKEEAEIDQFVEDINSVISSKAHDDVIQWFSASLAAEATKKQEGKSEEAQLVIPLDQSLPQPWKKPIPQLLKLISLEPLNALRSAFGKYLPICQQKLCQPNPNTSKNWLVWICSPMISILDWFQAILILPNFCLNMWLTNSLARCAITVMKSHSCI